MGHDPAKHPCDPGDAVLGVAADAATDGIGL